MKGTGAGGWHQPASGRDTRQLSGRLSRGPSGKARRELGSPAITFQVWLLAPRPVEYERMRAPTARPPPHLFEPAYRRQRGAAPLRVAPDHVPMGSSSSVLGSMVSALVSEIAIPSAVFASITCEPSNAFQRTNMPRHSAGMLVAAHRSRVPPVRGCSARKTCTRPIAVRLARITTCTQHGNHGAARTGTGSAEEARCRAERGITRVPGRVPSYHTSPVIWLLTNSSVASLAVTALRAIWFDCRAPRARVASGTAARKAWKGRWSVSGSAPPRHTAQ